MTTLSIRHKAKMTRFQASLLGIPSDSCLVEGLATSFQRNKAEREKDALLAAKILNPASEEEREQAEKEIVMREEAKAAYVAALEEAEEAEEEFSFACTCGTDCRY